MGDGRQQDGDVSEQVRRQAAGGRPATLPQAEAARRNEKPHHSEAPSDGRNLRELNKPEGSSIKIEEESGVAAAEATMRKPKDQV